MGIKKAKPMKLIERADRRTGITEPPQCSVNHPSPLHIKFIEQSIYLFID